MSFGILFAAVGLDLALGDPDRAWHPVRHLGLLIAWAERHARRNARRLRLRGAGLALLVVATAYLSGLLLLHWTGMLDEGLGLRGWGLFAAQAALVWMSLGIRSVAGRAIDVLAALETGDLLMARMAVARLADREMAELDERGVCRACLESLAEELADGVVGPLFFAALGGAPLALAYRAVITLDSQLGHKDEHYVELGWASAKLEHVVGWLPARKAALCAIAASVALRLDPRAAWKVPRAQAKLQPSPNSGWPEGAFAGALGVQLGGPLRYRGREVAKAHLGPPRRALTTAVCRSGLTLFLSASLVAVSVYEAAAWFKGH